ncbi:MAG: cation diffusion facilitator family transporter [Gemmatimonadaceae bacterium]
MQTRARPGIRAVQFGLLLNFALASIKVLTGLVGHSYALVADGVESTIDIVASLVVWGGLQIASREADEDYPFGYGRAEPLAAAIVALILIGAGVGIAIAALREIRTPHYAPEPYTLFVLLGVIVIKEVLFRRMRDIATATDSSAVHADAWHHRSDALTSLAAFVGISLALWKGWASADDWAALVASAVIMVNAVRVARPAIAELMDRSPERPMIERMENAARGVSGVRGTHKLTVRRHGGAYHVDVHVQADPNLTLHDAHVLSGKVKSAIRASIPQVAGVLVHMEPDEPQSGGSA